MEDKGDREAGEGNENEKQEEEKVEKRKYHMSEKLYEFYCKSVGVPVHMD
jgi:hypothetical protein